ncbi:hypothetical protein [Erwinia sp. JH02]|uniref:hypothetical protein n=1 Tax=Erwinia sp. JH02 TaxID=2733394 RepID=UPI0014886C82|nr:hypothetical protein [Erwinia sp. JH02]NNS09966.1 hypothetical protein [Erwinia sp. JH02]
MYSRPFALTRTEQVLLLVCASWLASAALYAFIAAELIRPVVDSGRLRFDSPEGRLLSGLRDYPLIFLLSLAGGFACGALVSIVLRRHVFTDTGLLAGEDV